MRKPDGKGPLGRPSHTWEDTIRIYLEINRVGTWNGFMWLMAG